MPHECTTCGRTFPDGSKEMLSGCPGCGGNKFQFHPGGTPSSETGSATPTDSDTSGESTATDPDSTSEPTTADSSFTFGSSRPGAGDDADRDPGAGDGIDRGAPTETDHGSPSEDRAQASARKAFVSDDELPHVDPDQDTPGAQFDPPARGPDGTPEPSGGDVDSSGNADDGDGRQAESEPADISELREELNEQFESIKIHARGEYELNLMELYDREEHIIAIQEDGRYAIDVPGSWRGFDEEAE
jgi:predicted  nucleic acid-binding Zn-ribbon protein